MDGGMREPEDAEEDEEGGGGGGGVRVVGRRLWMRLHSWQMRTLLQFCRKLRGGAGGGATRADAGGSVPLASHPIASSSSLCGPGPRSGPPPMPPPSSARPPVSGPVPL